MSDEWWELSDQKSLSKQALSLSYSQSSSSSRESTPNSISKRTIQGIILQWIHITIGV